MIREEPHAAAADLEAAQKVDPHDPELPGMMAAVRQRLEDQTAPPVGDQPHN